MEPGTVKVQIFDHEYTVRGGEDPSYVQEIAAFVDSRMRQVAQASSQISTARVAVLVALNIADELFQERQGKALSVEDIDERIEQLTRSLEESFDESAAETS